MKEKIEAVIRKSAGEHAPFDVFEPERKEFGHYSTNVALRLAKHLRKDPIKLAYDFVSKIREHEPKNFFEKIEVVPPGFINFWISPAALISSFEWILKEKRNYGLLKSGKKRKVQIEFVSANPTGPLTLANGRGGFLGDVLSNVFARAGWDVEREYYVNDTGNQIITFGKSIAAAAGLRNPEKNFYEGEYVKAWAAAHKAIVRRFAAKPLELGQAAAKEFLRGIKFALKHRARIAINRWTSENAIHKKKFAKKALAISVEKWLSYEKDGAVWLKTTEFGDDKDRVLLTRDGYPTYFLADAGHYLETKTRGFHKKILILGPDHYGYVKRIQAAAKIAGVADYVLIITQAVRLMRDGMEAT
ncbi:MAG: arginine--tRNA ligase, partial [bacterium]|nr:arginine--tRNA ligase [bacterium]